MANSITIESVGRRHYLRGNTYPIKDRLRSAGAKWDPDARAWWTGKREVAEQFAATSAEPPAAAAATTERPADRLTDDSKVVGRARYKGRECLLVWEGETRRGRAAKLAFTDGSKIFWADMSEVQVTKIYESRVWRGREEPMTFGRLAKLRERYAAEKQAEKNQCLVGVAGEYQAQFAADRHDLTPGCVLGSASWLRHGSVRIAVVLAGYETATYVRSEDAEDMGHFGIESGWYGMGHYRAATVEEYEALQAASARADGMCVPVGQAVVMALGGAS